MVNTTEIIRAISGNLGLKMSYKKTEIMSIGQSSGSNPIVPLGNEGLIKVVDHFKYLGAFCSADGTNVKELNSIIGKASAVFRELYKVWRDQNINLDTKSIFTKPVSFPHVYMHANAGHSTERDETRLAAFDMPLDPGQRSPSLQQSSENAAYNGLVTYDRHEPCP